MNFLILYIYSEFIKEMENKKLGKRMHKVIKDGNRKAKKKRAFLSKGVTFLLRTSTPTGVENSI